MPTSKLPETVCLWYFDHSLIVSESCRGRHFDFVGRLFSSPRISVGRMKKTSQGHSWGSLCSMGPLSTNFSQNDSIAAKLKVESLKRESITIDWYKTIRQHTPNVQAEQRCSSRVFQRQFKFGNFRLVTLFVTTNPLDLRFSRLGTTNRLSSNIPCWKKSKTIKLCRLATWLNQPDQNRKK